MSSLDLQSGWHLIHLPHTHTHVCSLCSDIPMHKLLRFSGSLNVPLLLLQCLLSIVSNLISRHTLCLSHWKKESWPDFSALDWIPTVTQSHCCIHHSGTVTHCYMHHSLIPLHSQHLLWSCSKFPSCISGDCVFSILYFIHTALLPCTVTMVDPCTSTFIFQFQTWIICWKMSLKLWWLLVQRPTPVTNSYHWNGSFILLYWDFVSYTISDVSELYSVSITVMFGM